ncbi:porin family protein [Fulvivirgaceae bacterium BMA10]|uniref:Porin family protein n=1 Tax=Splendidivirga corallicola TaxID=3051826 RepID=A0ABT8KTX7_9BACT|nr:porin family protein [Fulvivirgaceae bacterium BMA10]
MMKTVNLKSVTILFVMMFFTSMGYGQDDQQQQEKPKPTFSLRAGATMSKLSVIDNHWSFSNGIFGAYTKNSYKPGFYIGTNMDIKLSEKGSLSLGLLYSQKGALAKREVSLFEEKVKLHYVNIPILYKRHISNRFSLYGGVEAGALVDSRIINGSVINAVNNQFLTGDLGGVAGISYDFNDQFYLDFRWVEGITKLNFLNPLHAIGATPVHFEARNRSIQLGMGYKIF